MQPKGVLVAALLAVLVGAGIWLLQNDPQPTIPDVPTPIGNPDPEGNDPVALRTGNPEGNDRQPTDDPGLDRKPVVHEIPSGATAEQGVKGRLVGPSGAPVEGAKVYLLRGTGLSTFKIFQQWKMGEQVPPVGAATSIADGSFRVGLKKWSDEEDYQIYVMHDDYCDHREDRIRPQPMDWYDVETIELKRGVTVFGSVTGPGGVLANATVTAKQMNNNTILSPPGRQNGIETVTDESGQYRLSSIDPKNLAGMTARAAGHSTQERSELQIVGDQVRIDFQLDEGLDIGGIVIGPDGKPVRNASVVAAALSQKARQEERDVTNAQGEFLVSGLKKGKFTVIVEAPGYGRADETPVDAGDLNVRVILDKLGTVEVTVLGKNGTPLRSFQCNLKPAIRGQDGYGKPMLRKAARNARDGTLRLEGIRPHTYVAEIIHKDYAKNFSERFTISTPQRDTPKVTVRLNQGGTLRGVVRGPGGNPIGGVQVSTMPNDLVENPLILAFGGAPYTISRATAKTRPDGSYEFKRMHPGKYQLKFKHNDYCTVFSKGHIAELDKETVVPETIIQAGCLVSGIARLDGKPEGQIKVMVNSAPGNPSPISAEAVTDNEGRFLLTKRMPPGNYVAKAGKSSGGPFVFLLQMRKQTKFVIPEGLNHHQLLLDVDSSKK